METQTLIVGFLLGLATMYLFQRIFGKVKKASDIMKTIHNPIVKAEYEFARGIMTVKYHNGQVSQYQGSSTVWHSFPLMKRIGTMGEGRLCDIYKYIKIHGNPYPTSHIKKEEDVNI